MFSVSPDGSKFKLWDNVTASDMTKGDQLFCCAPISSNIYPYIAFEVTKSFGGLQTYINRILIYSDEVFHSPTAFDESSKEISQDLIHSGKKLEFNEVQSQLRTASKSSFPHNDAIVETCSSGVDNMNLAHLGLGASAIDLADFYTRDDRNIMSSARNLAHENTGIVREIPCKFNCDSFKASCPRGEETSRRLNRDLKFEEVRDSTIGEVIQRIDHLEKRLSALLKKFKLDGLHSPSLGMDQPCPKFAKIVERPFRGCGNWSGEETRKHQISTDIGMVEQGKDCSQVNNLRGLESAVDSIQKIVHKAIENMKLQAGEYKIGRTIPQLRSLTHHPPRPSIHLHLHRLQGEKSNTHVKYPVKLDIRGQTRSTRHRRW